MTRTPWILGGLAAALLLQHPARADDELNAASAKVFAEAIAAVEKKDWAVCRTKAIGVWQQIKNPKVAGILGICEAELKMHRDAAEHLDSFFANQKGSTACPGGPGGAGGRGGAGGGGRGGPSVGIAFLGTAPEETTPAEISLGAAGPGGAGGNGGPGNIATSGAAGLAAERQAW